MRGHETAHLIEINTLHPLLLDAGGYPHQSKGAKASRDPERAKSTEEANTTKDSAKAEKANCQRHK